MKKTIRLRESELKQMISESVRRVLNEMEDYPQEFRNWLNDPKHYGFYRYFDEMPQSQKDNVYQAYQEEMAEKNFSDGMRVGNRQGFKNDKGDIEWHGNGTINGWRSNNSKWTPQESELKEMISKMVKRTLNEVSGWSLEKEDVTWVNDAESGGSDKAWMVRLWTGRGYALPAFGAYATCEQDALEKVVAYLDKEGDDSFFCDEYVEQMEEELAQEGKDEEEIQQEIDEQFCYVDATMDGGECHYVFWENLAIYPYDEKHFR